MIEERIPHPELAPSILSMVERERAEKYAATYWLIQKGFTLKEASHLIHWQRWAHERIGSDR